MISINRRNALYGLVIVGAMVGLAWFLIASKQQQLSQAPAYGEQPRPVTVEESTSGILKKTIPYLAEVEARKTTRLRPRVQATAETIHVNEGDRVGTNEILIELDDREIRSRIQSTEEQIKQNQAEKRGQQAQLESLKETVSYRKKETERIRRLYEKDLAALSTLDQEEQKLAEAKGQKESTAEAVNSLDHRIQSLKNQLDELQTRLKYYTLRSPYPARVQRRMIDPGDLASPESSVLVLEDMQGFMLNFDVPKDDLDQLSKGQTVRYKTRTQTDTATISLIHPSFDENRLLRVEVWLRSKPGHWSSGEYIPLEVITDRIRNVTFVPRSALITSPDGQHHVFVARDNQLESVPVNVQGFEKDRAAVKGLNPGEDVVKNSFLGWTRLTGGQKITPIR